MSGKVQITNIEIPSDQSLARKLLADPDFSDVTLVSKDNQYTVAHRAVLSSSSDFLRCLLYGSLQQNTFLFLGLVDQEVVEALVTYVYTGQCELAKDRLDQLGSLAARLEIRGLEDALQDFMGKYRNGQRADSASEAVLVDDPYKLLSYENKHVERINISINDSYNKKQFSRNAIKSKVGSHNMLIPIENKRNLETTQQMKDPNESNKKERKFNIHERKEISLLTNELVRDEVPNIFYDNRNWLKLETNNDVSLTKKRKTYLLDGLPYVKSIEPNADMSFSCDECNYTTKNGWFRLKCHKLKVHLGFEYTCQQCGEKFDSWGPLNQHKKHIHEGVYFKCVICKQQFKSSGGLKHHKYIMQPISCAKCEYVACNKKMFDTHNKKIHGIQQLSCTLCPYTTKLYNPQPTSRLKNHMRIVHEGLRFSCKLCTFKTSGNSNLKEHHQVVHEELKFNCDQCEYSCNGKALLGRHGKMKHEEIWHSCDQCEYKSKDTRSFREHKRAIHEKIQLKCKHCNIKVLYPSSLRRHMRNVHENFRFSCHTCSFTSKHHSSLKIHEKRGHANYFYCNICENTFFANVSELDKHKKVYHKQDLPICCDLCDFSTRSTRYLDSHKKVSHEGLRFECEMCDFKSTSKSYIRIHNETKHLEKCLSTSGHKENTPIVT